MDNGNNTGNFFWQDISNQSDSLPTRRGIIFAKVLKLDAVASVKRASRIRLLRKQMPKSNDSIISNSPSNGSNVNQFESNEELIYTEETQSEPKRYPTINQPRSNPTELSSSPRTPMAAVEVDLFSFDDAPQQQTSNAAPSNPSPRPNIASEINSSAYASDAIDEDNSNQPTALSRLELAARREANVQGKVKEALEFKLELDEKVKREADETDQAKDKFEKILDGWASNNKEKRNLRTLLSTMHTVLWPGNTWKQVGLGDLLDPGKVKLQYRKAMLVVHPDRCSVHSVEVRFIAKRVFEAINEAYQEFLKKESV